MENLSNDFISGIDFGEVQVFKNLQIIPLFTKGEEVGVSQVLRGEEGIGFECTCN